MLSSRWTYFLKYIVGPFWILCFGVVAWTVALSPDGGLTDGRGAPPPPGMQWLLVFIWIVMSIGILRFTFAMKRVELRGDRLFVSNYFREWEIFPSDIESVRQNRWANARPIRVRLRREIDGVGSSFAFMPPQRAMLRFWREDPQVEQLRRFAEASAGGKTA